MSTITPQYLAYDSAPLTYTAVSSNDLIYPVTGAMVLHIFNASETDDAVVFYPSDAPLPGHAITPPSTLGIEAGGEVVIGPFDYVAYAPSLTVTHSATDDVYIAAFFSELIVVETAIALATETAVTAYSHPLETAELTTVSGVINSQTTILAGVLPNATAEIEA